MGVQVSRDKEVPPGAGGGGSISHFGRTGRPGRPGRASSAGSPRGRDAGRGPTRSGRRPGCGSPASTALLSRPCAVSVFGRPPGGYDCPSRRAGQARQTRRGSRRSRTTPRPTATAGRRRAPVPAGRRTAPAGSPRSRRASPRRPAITPGCCVLRRLRVLFDQLFGEGDRPFVAVKGLGRSAELADQTAEINLGAASAELGDLGVVVDDLLMRRQRLQNSASASVGLPVLTVGASRVRVLASKARKQ